MVMLSHTIYIALFFYSIADGPLMLAIESSFKEISYSAESAFVFCSRFVLNNTIASYIVLVVAFSTIFNTCDSPKKHV